MNRGRKMKQYIVTGATGYIGSMLVEKLLQEGKNVTVLVRKPERLKNTIYDKVKIVQADIVNHEEIRQITGSYDYLIHCAAATQSAYMMSNPVEVAESIVHGTKNMLELAVRCQVKSMVYVSSMEVYGCVDCSNGSRVKENELGALDIANIRSCYPMAKRMAESFCYLYHKEYGVPVKIARLSQTFGRGVKSDENRIFAQIAKAVQNNMDIVLHTKGNSMGNYCDIDDAIEAILFLLNEGDAAEAYNIVNEDNTMTIRQMAELVIEKIAKGKLKIIYDIPEDNRFGYAAKTGLRLSGEKIKKLGWEAKVSLEEMYRRMIFGK